MHCIAVVGLFILLAFPIQRDGVQLYTETLIWYPAPFTREVELVIMIESVITR